MTETLTLTTLRDLILEDTGFDPTTEPAFEYATDEPCDVCGTVTATAVVNQSWDDTRFRRVCADCYMEAR